MTNNRYDGHIHFNPAKADPLADLFDELERNALHGAVLILNSLDEKELFRRHAQCIRHGALRVHPAGLIDPRAPKEGLAFLRFLEDAGFDYSVKLHPRLSGTVRDDIPAALALAEQLPGRRIIVDGFYYGDRLEHQVHLELALALARAHPERGIVYAHAGGIHVLETLVHARPLKNIRFDLSLSVNYLQGTSAWADLAHFLRYNRDRVFFGSDYPDFPVADAIRACQALILRSGLPSEETESLVFGGNNPFFGDA